MFWILLTIMAAVLALVSHSRTSIQNRVHTAKNEKKKEANFATFCMIISTVSLFLVLGMGLKGMKNYPSLVDKLATIKALQQRVESIRDTKQGSTHALVDKVVAGFVADLAILEADYNGHLERCKVYKEEFPLYFFGNGWAISDKVFTLERILTDGFSISAFNNEFIIGRARGGSSANTANPNTNVFVQGMAVPSDKTPILVE